MVDFTEDFSQYAVSKLPNFKDNFAFYGTQAEADASWVPVDVARSRVNTATDVLDLDIFRDNTNDAIAHDLGSTISNSNWVLRFKLTIDTLNQQALQTQGFFGLFDQDEISGEETQQDSIGVVLTCLTGTLTYRLFSSDNDFISQGVSTTFAHALAVETVYVEIKRNSRTSYVVNLYSDAKFTDLIESQQGTCSDGTIDLRYIGMKNNMSMTNGSRILGSMDDIEFWEAGNKPTFQDDFSTYINQTQADNAWVPNDSAQLRVNPATDVLDFDMLMDGSNDAIAIDLGVGNVDDNKWILRFKLNITTQTQATTGMLINIGIGDSDQTVGSTASQDWIGFNYINNNTFNGRWICAQSDNAQINAAGGNGTPVNELLPTATDIFFEIKRINATSMEVNRYSDSTYNTILGTSTHSGFTGTTGLRYLKLTNLNLSLAAGVGIGTIDNIEFYDGVAEVPSSIEFAEGAVSIEEKFVLGTPQINDDFSVDNWVETGTLNQVSGGALAFNFDRDTTNHKTVRDLTVVSDTEWTLRWCQINSTVTQTGTPATLGYVGMIDTDNTTPANGTNDFIGLEYVVDDVNNLIRLIDANGSALSSGTVRYTFTEVNAVNTRYWEVKRLSDVTMIANVYSDSTYTTLIETSGVVTCSASVIGLQHIGVITDNQATSVSAHDGTLDDMQFWNGESLLSRWNVNATEGELDTVNNRINWTMLRNGTDNRVVRDLGTALSNENWTLRFRYHINAGGVQTTDSGANYQVLLQDTDVGQSATNDTIGWSMQSTVGAPGRTFVLLGRNGGSTSGFATTANAIIPYAGAVDLYVEMKRTSSTTVEARVFNDSQYTDLLEGTELSITTSVANIGHQFLACSSGDDNSPTWDGTETGFIDCIELYDCASVARTSVTREKSFEDSFWEDNWTDIGAQHGVNVSTRVIDWDSARLAEAINQTTFDLETIFPEGINPVKWGLRFKYRIDAVTAGGAASQFAVFLTSLASNNSSEVAQDHATWKIQGNVPPALAGMIDDGTQIYTGASASFGNGATVGEFGYAEMTRNGTLFTWAVYSDPDFTQKLGSGSRDDNSVLAGLRYLKVGRRDGGATGFTFNGIVDNIQFWNGNEPTEHKNKWVEVNVA